MIGRRLLLLLLAMVVAACSDPCEQRLGEYPPDHIVVTGVGAVDVPHIGWDCPGFHSDTIEPPPSVAPDPEGNILVEVTMEDGSTIDVRFGNQPVVVDPAPVDGANSWVLRVPASSEPLVIRLCSEDDACALYWANTYGLGVQQGPERFQVVLARNPLRRLRVGGDLLRAGGA